MFNPSREQVRQFFSQTWTKVQQGLPLAGAEQQAGAIMLLHPEYHALLSEPQSASQVEYPPESGQMNPFLHLSLHLAIEEQIAIDQPGGIRKEFERLLARSADRHAALHEVLECLGEEIWRAQNRQAPLDGESYLECLKRR